MQRESRPSWTSTESAETWRTQRRHRLRRRTRVTACDSHGRLRTGVDPVGRARLLKRTLRSDIAMADSDDEWEFVKHVEGSSNHIPQGYGASWTGYWSHHTNWSHHTGRPLPTLCPGVPEAGVGAHPLSYSDAHGSHVLIKNIRSGREKYVIIPTCKRCNVGKVPVHLFCRAVTIFDSDAANKFVGKITLPNEYAVERKEKTWWVYIHSFNVDDKDCDKKKQSITIVGYSNKDLVNRRTPGRPCGQCTFSDTNHVCTQAANCKLRRAIYPNTEDFLAELALLWRRVQKGRNMHIALTGYEGGFSPEIMRCKVGWYPPRRAAHGGRAEYKEAYRLCMEEGCNQDRVGITRCEQHPEPPPLNDADNDDDDDNDDDNDDDGGRDAQANDTATLVEEMKGLDVKEQESGPSSSAQPASQPHGKGVAR